MAEINKYAKEQIESIRKICDRRKPLVVIHCITYNHEPYIRDALDGFVMQKTNFPYVAIVHEDVSTDNTAEIIKEFAEKYPEIILPIFERENQYSRGSLAIVMNEACKATGAKYIAWCEGDDYWTDPLKLQKQVDAMEIHPDVDACTHKQIQYHAITKELLRIKTHGEKVMILPLKDVILGEGGFVGTNTMLYRSECYLKIMRFRSFMDYDYSNQIQAALRGGILYIPEIISAYNEEVPGSFTSSMKEKGEEAHMQYVQKKMKMLDMLDEDTNFVYHRIITARKLLYTVTSITPFTTNIKYLRKYYSGFKELYFVEKVKTLLRIAASCIRYRLYKK